MRFSTGIGEVDEFNSKFDPLAAASKGSAIEDVGEAAWEVVGQVVSHAVGSFSMSTTVAAASGADSKGGQVVVSDVDLTKGRNLQGGDHVESIKLNTPERGTIASEPIRDWFCGVEPGSAVSKVDLDG